MTAAAERFQKAAQQLGVPLPEEPANVTTVADWIRYGPRLTSRVSQVVEALAYFTKLAALTEGHSIEDLSRSRSDLSPQPDPADES
ncbi:MAG: hypothetical protein HC898_11085 [Phycisphaerales bacterium]|nr:hypothetical protein [Phycisphaerales bacterium]